MKRIVLLLISIITAIVSFCQQDVRAKNIVSDRMMRVPLDTFASLPNGSIAYKNGIIYYRDTYWKSIGALANALNGLSKNSTGDVVLGGSTVTQYTAITLSSNPVRFIHSVIHNSTQIDSNGVIFINPTLPTGTGDSLTSPPLTFIAYGRKTFGGTSVQPVEFMLDNLGRFSTSVQGSFRIRSRINETGAYKDLLTIASTTGDMAGPVQANGSKPLSVNSVLFGQSAGSSGGLVIGGTSSTLQNNVSGQILIAIGADCLTANTTGNNNFAMGPAFSNNTTGSNNIAFGVSALVLATTADFNTAVGHGAMSHVTIGGQNAAYGYNALSANTIGIKNVAIGPGAMENGTSPNYSVAVGEDCMLHNIDGSNNNAIGWLSGSLAQHGWNNNSFGWSSGRSHSDGWNNTFIGHSSGYLALDNSVKQNDTIRGSTAIGAYSYTTQDYEIAPGDDSTQHFTYRGDGVSIRADSAGKFRIQSKTNVFDTAVLFGTKDHYGLAMVRTNDADYLRTYIKNMTSGNLQTIDGLGTNVIAGKFQFTQNSVVYSYQQPLPIIRTLPYAADDPTHVYNVWIQNDTSSNNVFPWRDSSYYNPFRVDYMTHGGDTQTLFIVRADSRIFGAIQSDPGGKSMRYNTSTKEITYTDTLPGDTYTPTLTGVTNVASSSISSNSGHFQRVGKEVSWSVVFTVTPTAGSAVTQIAFSLPIASNLAASKDLVGSGSVVGATYGVGQVSGDNTNDRAQVEFFSSNTSAHTVSVTGHYIIK